MPLSILNVHSQLFVSSSPRRLAFSIHRHQFKLFHPSSRQGRFFSPISSTATRRVTTSTLDSQNVDNTATRRYKRNDEPEATNSTPPPPPSSSMSQPLTMTENPFLMTTTDFPRLSSIDSPPNARIARVAILGTPNAGKSTLLNTILDRKLSAVSHVAHTTRVSSVGVLTRDQTQLVFLDTPGVLPWSSATAMTSNEDKNQQRQQRKRLEHTRNREPVRLSREAWEAARACDVAVLLIDAQRPIEKLTQELELARQLRDLKKPEWKGKTAEEVEQAILEREMQAAMEVDAEATVISADQAEVDVNNATKRRKRSRSIPTAKATTKVAARAAARTKQKSNLILVLNKMDMCHPRSKAAQLAMLFNKEGGFDQTFAICARRATSIQDLQQALLDAAHLGNWEFASQDTTNMSLKQRVIEIVREKTYRRFRQELPHQLKHNVKSIQETDTGDMKIEYELGVTRSSQMKIVIPHLSTMAHHVQQDLSAALFSAQNDHHHKNVSIHFNVTVKN